MARKNVAPKNISTMGEFELTKQEGKPPDGCENPMEEKPTKRSITKNEIIAWSRKVSRFLMWTICTMATIVFTWSAIQEYLEDNPVTVVTYMDPPDHPDPMEIRVCNMVALDSSKILNYDGEFKDTESYQFLYGLMSGNTTVNNLEWALSSTTRNYFLLSSRILKEFSYDVKEWMAACYVVNSNESCILDFEWELSADGVCYKASIDMKGYGPYRTLGIFFYFDPSKTMGGYSSATGVFGSISQKGGTLGSHDGFFISPQTFVIISGVVSYRHQAKSFAKSKCAHRDGLEPHYFTGEPFQAEYSPKSCSDLCYIKVHYKHCQCSFATGWNLTNTECMENREARLCLVNLFYDFEKVEKEAKACRAECISKCEQRIVQTTTSEVDVEFQYDRLFPAFVTLYGLSSNNVLAGQLAQTIKSSPNPKETADEIAKHVAQLTFYLESDKPEKHVEIIPIMTLPTFLGNMGGLIGMWLGVSAISLIEVLELLVHRLISRQSCIPNSIG